MALDVIVAGELYLDLILSGFDRFPEPGQEVYAREMRREPGGAAITAMGLAKLGVRTGMAAAVGIDGRFLVDALCSAGVDTSAVVRLSDDYTGTTVAISTANDRAFATYRGAANKFTLDRFDARHLHWAAGVDSGTLEAARARGLTISLDIGFAEANPKTLEALSLTDVFFPNEMELRRMTGESTTEAALAAAQRATATQIVVKLGSRGSAMLVEGSILHVAPPPVEAVDPTGAGDSFDAGFLCAWLRGEPSEACLRLGNICGALSTRALGGISAFPTPEEIACLSKSP